jgi:hypothetical protein
VTRGWVDEDWTLERHREWAEEQLGAVAQLGELEV